MTVIAVPFIALLPDLTLMFVSRVMNRSPADVHMLRQKAGKGSKYERM